jgi:hypothetical protein
MSIRLLDADGAKEFRTLINADPEFKLISRDMTLSLSLEMGSEQRLINFRDGKALKIERFVALTESIDISIRGPTEFWQRMLSPLPPPGFQNLYAAVRFRKCEVIGNSELFFAYYAAITRMIELLQEHQNS